LRRGQGKGERLTSRSVASSHHVPSHHGEILRVQEVANCRIFASRHRPHLVLPKHAHDRACIGFVLGGQGEESIDHRVLDLTQNVIFFRPAGEIHANKSGRTGLHCLIAEVAVGWLEHVRDCMPFPTRPTSVRDAGLTWLFTRLYQECRLGRFASPLVIEGLLLEIAAGFARQQLVGPIGHAPIWLGRAKEALHAHFQSPLRLSTVAAWVGIHPVHLAREFRKYHGCSVGQYVRRLRVESASRKLVESDSPLAAIAVEVGFANQAHFSRIFKSVTGISPAQYRAESRAANRRHNVLIVKDPSAPRW